MLLISVENGAALLFYVKNKNNLKQKKLKYNKMQCNLLWIIKGKYAKLYAPVGCTSILLKYKYKKYIYRCLASLAKVFHENKLAILITQSK